MRAQIVPDAARRTSSMKLSVMCTNFGTLVTCRRAPGRSPPRCGLWALERPPSPGRARFVGRVLAQAGDGPLANVVAGPLKRVSFRCGQLRNSEWPAALLCATCTGPLRNRPPGVSSVFVRSPPCRSGDPLPQQPLLSLLFRPFGSPHATLRDSRSVRPQSVAKPPPTPFKWRKKGQGPF